jgi:hypothetical protein
MIHFPFPIGRDRLHALPGHPSLPDSFLTLILDPYFALKKKKERKKKENEPGIVPNDLIQRQTLLFFIPHVVIY